jgi:hypothetical protein
MPTAFFIAGKIHPESDRTAVAKRANAANSLVGDRPLSLSYKIEISALAEQAAAVADRDDTQFPQILGSQPRQDRSVDVIVAENRGVLFESQSVQPIGVLRGRGTALYQWRFIRRLRISRSVAKSIHVHAIAKAPSARALSASAVMQWAANSG